MSSCAWTSWPARSTGDSPRSTPSPVRTTSTGSPTNSWRPSALDCTMTAMGESEAEVLAWCVVANVAQQMTFGEDAEPRRGLKHFSAGAKLWVLPPQWGDGGKHVIVVGRHRGRGPGKL